MSKLQSRKKKIVAKILTHQGNIIPSATPGGGEHTQHESDRYVLTGKLGKQGAFVVGFSK